ncbi:hypothetical protein OIU34_23990 [Pararhizobium sp. BT-229]|uniref:hypothetical protein n=1 Tax=Pararhizobium sp. BT-229 TaxID=2986923 RepID=UPI0021F7ACBD|nr:hypothetical protein [Pararhizobium sp. BT-229]MCV9964960.1 hypothetical protein [Pararhizobium sp. BT-229]
MTTRELGPISALDPSRAYKDYFDGPARERSANGLDLGLVIDSAVAMSVEVLWPSILKLSRQAQSGDIVLSDGWSVRSVRTSDAHDSTFVMEHEDTPGGFLFNCRVRPEKVDGRELEIVSQVMCCAYRADGLFPPGYSGLGNELDETLETGFDKYQVGQLFNYKPSIHLQLIGPSFGRFLMPSSSPVSDPDMALQAINIVGDAFTELDYEPEIDARAEELGKLVIDHFKAGVADAQLIEMGAGACRGGFISEQMVGTSHHFWAQAAALDFERLANRLAASIDKLEDDGFTDAVNAFEWQDMDRSAFVGKTTDGEFMVWLETQQTTYRIDIKRDADNGTIRELSVAMVNGDKGPGAKPTPEDRGYLGEFVREDEGADFSIYEIGEMTTSNIRGMNGVISAIDCLAGQLEKAATRKETATPAP